MPSKCSICGANLIFNEESWDIVCTNGHKQS